MSPLPSRRHLGWPLALVVLALRLPALAQQPTGPAELVEQLLTPGEASEEEEVPTADVIDQRRDELATRIEELRARRSRAVDEERVEEAQRLGERLTRLRETDQVYARQRSELARRQRLQEELEILEGVEEEGLEGLVGHAPPYSVSELDRVVDDRRRADDRMSILDNAIDNQQQALEAAREETARRERQRRRAREELELNEDPAAQLALQRQLQQAEERAVLARQRERLLELELDNARADLALEEERADFYRAAEAAIRQSLAPSTEERDERLLRLEERAEEIRRQRDQARLAVRSARSRADRVRERLDAEEVPSEALREEAEARRLELDAANLEVGLLEDHLRWLDDSRHAVEVRFRNLRGELEADTKDQEVAQLEETLRDLEEERREKEGDLLTVRAEVRQLASRIEGLSEDGETRRWLTEQREQLEAQVALYEQNLEVLESIRARFQRVLAELEAQSTAERLGTTLRRLWSGVVGFWTFELFAVQDQPITPGKIILTLILILVGYAIAKRLTGFLGRKVFPRLGLHPAAAAAFQTLIFYFLVVLVGLYALDIVNIDLTVFAVLGGALALGVGFGSQNIVNNFISGLILLAERPIKVGDLVDVEGTYGKVERIGMRSTRVRSGNNTHVIVPNSAFLEKNVLNWTLSDETIRTYLDVGVVYGSPTRDVTRLLHRAMKEHGQVLDHPGPEVLFTDFGDNALLFRAYFWIRVRAVLDRLRIQSDLRYRIDSLFREAGIVIAFPQRDVHLDSTSPVQVRLLPSEAEGPEPARATAKVHGRPPSGPLVEAPEEMSTEELEGVSSSGEGD